MNRGRFALTTFFTQYIFGKDFSNLLKEVVKEKLGDRESGDGMKNV
jgi:hypothetical protein